jgi:KipI family sensor histidine kinase inhibitor
VTPDVRVFGERALLAVLGDVFSEDLVVRARALADAWESLGHGPAVPAYASTLLCFDPDRLAHDAAMSIATRLATPDGQRAPARTPRVIDIPTRYDGPDLADVAERSGLTTDALVELHASRTYTAYFLGFLPGFAYCGRLDPRIVAPRLDRPRERVPAGAVAVADGQTAVYPFASPGGWRLIGATTVICFDPSRDPASLIAAGDQLRFVPL